jgi:manganese/zinc/iron transport system substrate-binding protein
MKKLIMIFLLCLLAFGCAKSNHKNKGQALCEWMEPNQKIKVLSTTAVIDDLVSRIGKEHITHRALIEGQLDPHSYELVKGDNEIISSADIIFYNGLELEHGASLKYQLAKHSGAYSLGDILAEKSPESLIFFEGQVDPHIWMDIRLFSKLIDPIIEVLSKEDPEHAEEFKNNGELLRVEMISLDKDIDDKIKNIPKEERYLITSHDAFFYFARRYLAETSEIENAHWKTRFAAPEGLAPDGQISPKDIQFIIEYAMAHGVKVIFPESNLNQDALKKIVSVLNQKGEKTLLAKEILYGDAMGDKGSNADTYLKMMEHNANVIVLYLTGEIHG